MVQVRPRSPQPTARTAPPPPARDPRPADAPRAERESAPEPEAHTPRPSAERAGDARTRHAADPRSSQLRARVEAPRGGRVLNPGNAQAGRDFARVVERQRVDWEHPGAALGNLSQIDSGRGAQRGGHDGSRCGAAALTAGVVAQGPGRAHQSIDRLLAESRRVRGEVEGHSMRLPNPGGGQEQRLGQLAQADATLRDLRRRDPESWTYGDMQRFQEATYQIARVSEEPRSPDARLPVGRETLTAPTDQRLDMDAGLRTDTVRRFRDVVWGEGAQPRIDGRPVDVAYRSDGQRGDGHFVLTEGRVGRDDTATRPVVYDPWPTEHGTAYSLGAGDAPRRVAPVPAPGARGVERAQDIDATF